MDDRLSRPAAFTDSTGNTTFARYRYLGAGSVIEANQPAVSGGQALTYDPAGDGSYGGLDRLGRVTRHLWKRTSGTAIFDIRHAYDRASNRLNAHRQVYKGNSEQYAYDQLNRLTSFKSGIATADGNGAMTAVQSHWLGREQGWSLDSVGNQTVVKDFVQSSYYTGTFNAVNEFADADGSRKVKGNSGKFGRHSDSFGNSTTLGSYRRPDGNTDAFSISDGFLNADTVSADMYDGHPEEEPRAVAVIGESIGGSYALTYVRFPTGSGQDANHYAGVAFGYTGPNDYWMVVLEKVPGASNDRRRVYHVVDGAKTLVKDVSLGYDLAIDTTYALYEFFWRNSCPQTGYTFPAGQGMPSGQVGLVTNRQGVKFDSLHVSDDSMMVDLLGRWTDGMPGTRMLDSERLYLGGYGMNKCPPCVLRNVRLDKFRSTFRVNRYTGTSSAYLYFSFNVADPHSTNTLALYHATTGTAPVGYEAIDGNSAAEVPYTLRSSSEVPAAANVDSDLWYRIICDGNTVTVKALLDDADDPTEQEWTDANACYQSGSFQRTGGGYLGFAGGHAYVDDLTIDGWDGQASAWKTEMVERFTVSTAGYAEHRPSYDAAGNLTFDGLHRYGYDGWGRLASVERAWRDPNGALRAGSTVVTMEYDGLHRRTRKMVANCGDWDCSYRYWWDEGWRLLETRTAGGQAVQQQLWGLRYVDELLQVAVNADPSQDGLCESLYYPMQNANFNVLGLMDANGTLVERYEYTPYGQRTVFKKAGGNDTLTTAPLLHSQPVIADAQPAPYSLCDFGHQGLQHDKEFGWWDNRFRYGDPSGRSPQRDRAHYPAAMNMSEYLRSKPEQELDPLGLAPTSSGRPVGFDPPSSNETPVEYVDRVSDYLRAIGPSDDRWNMIMTKGSDLRNEYFQILKSSDDPGAYLYGTAALAHEYERVMAPILRKEAERKERQRVQVCCRDPDINRTLDACAKAVGLKHCWVKTQKVEAGMGPLDYAGALPSSPSGPCCAVEVKIADHAGEHKRKGVECYDVPDCNAETVESKLIIDARLGKFDLTQNNCNTFVKSTLRSSGCYNRCLQRDDSKPYLLGPCLKWAAPVDVLEPRPEDRDKPPKPDAKADTK